MSELAYQDVIRPVFVSILIGGISLGIAFLVMRDSIKASLVASLAILFFYSFGDLTDLLQEQTGLGFARSNFSVLVIMVMLVCLWAIYVHRRLEKPISVNLYFNVVSLFLLTSSLFQLGTNLSESGMLPFFKNRTEATPVAETTEMLPDIYIIILDGYGRQDILEEFYDFDNTDFITQLENIGFYVAKESNSNYIQTLLSVGSMFNMDYISELEIEDKPISNRQDLIEIVKHSEVRRILAENGYGMISFRNGYKATVPDAEIFYDDASSGILHPITGFESIVLKHTMLRVLSQWRITDDLLVEMPYKTHRNQILSTFTRMQEIPNFDGNYFVYAHIISPHPPFIFEEDGEFISHRETFSLFDANYYIKTHSQKQYIMGYSKQVKYINKLVLESVDEILSRSETPPIIIIQGDHGPGAYLHWGSLEKTLVEERFGILNAYYFPEEKYDMLYPSISPVNSFRVVLNLLSNSNYILASDDYYYSKWIYPMEFTEVYLP